MSFVFDSSALLALLRDEEGAEVVSDLLENGAVPKFVHAVNLCEVYYDVIRNSDALTAEDAIVTLKEAGLAERNDLDGEFWRDIAALIADRRRMGNRLALGDACGLALARRLNANFVTADRSEMQAVSECNAASVLLIR